MPSQCLKLSQTSTKGPWLRGEVAKLCMSVSQPLRIDCHHCGSHVACASLCSYASFLHESLQLHQFCACLKPAQNASSADRLLTTWSIDCILAHRLHVSCTLAGSSQQQLLEAMLAGMKHMYPCDQSSQTKTQHLLLASAHRCSNACYNFP